MNHLSQNSKKAGLYFGYTGKPLFILATTADLSEKPFEITDPSQILSSCNLSQHMIDRSFEAAIRGFFGAGGDRLVVLPLHIDKDTNEITEMYLKSVRGSDGGFQKRKGYPALKDYDALADLIALPQASFLLNAEELCSLYQHVENESLKPKNLFSLLDTPSFQETTKIIDWAKPLQSDSSAIFYPGASIENIGFVSASVIAAASLQAFDRLNGISQSPANRDLPVKITPLVTLDEENARDLSRARINVFRNLPLRQPLIWGSYTRSTKSNESLLIHLERALMSLRDAAERICEVFLLEPRNQQTCEKIRDSLESTLEDLNRQGFMATTEDKVPYRVDVQIEKVKGDFDAPINVQIDIALEDPDRFVGIQLDFESGAINPKRSSSR